MDNYNVYHDIKSRTGGEIYIGVVGPVRTGKSTFIKNFMDLLVIPGIEDVNIKERAIDELPQSASGRTIMTTEPKFVPSEAAVINLNEDCEVKVRLIDCVGFMVDGASGHIEDEHERMVKTPWSDDSIPFSQAAEIGTRKVINEHSTVGVVVTSDGSFGELSRSSYEAAEKTAVAELNNIGKPYVIILNTSRPYSEETAALAESMMEEYHVSVIPVNCEQIKKDDITNIMNKLLMEFPVTRINYYIPKWVEMLSMEHELKQNLVGNIKNNMKKVNALKDMGNYNFEYEGDYITGYNIKNYSPENGVVNIGIEFDECYYYKIISDITGLEIDGEYKLLSTLRELASGRNSIRKIENALDKVNITGYGVVSPLMEEVQIEEPEIIKHGNKYGVKIRAVSPSIHMIKANIETEIAPIVGTREQAEDLINYINDSENPDGIWDTNIFGKTVRQLVEEGIYGKINKLTDESQVKLQETIQKVINDSNGGLVCIII